MVRKDIIRPRRDGERLRRPRLQIRRRPPSWAAKALAEEIPFDKAADHMAGLDQPIPAK
jgi:hypothetical protein